MAAALSGLVLGAIAGLAAAHSAFGVVVTVILLLLYAGLWADLPIVTDLAEWLFDLLWSIISRVGHGLAGTLPPDGPVPFAVHAAFTVCFVLAMGFVWYVSSVEGQA